MSEKPRHIGVATSARSDFGPLMPLLEAMREDPKINLGIYATGMHFSKLHGNTVEEIRNKGFTDHVLEIPCLPADDSPEAIVASMASGLSGFSEAFARKKPDILVVLGDRYDILPAVNAALLFNLPVAHISGGEVTEGVIDDSIRHAITKLSHLHFPAHEDYKRRLVQLGEEPWRITVSGEPGLDGIEKLPFKTRADIFGEFEFTEDRPLTVFTFHPQTLDPGGSADAIATILAATDKINSQILFTYPNTDIDSQPIIEAIEEHCRENPDCQIHPSLGRVRYLNLIKYANCIVGNSSSGIVESASFGIPVVDIGNRQRGRITPDNVTHVPCDREEIARAWLWALDPEVRTRFKGMENPFGHGQSTAKIIAVLKSVPLGRELLIKKFYDIPVDTHVPKKTERTT